MESDERRDPPMLTRDDILRQVALQMALDHRHAETKFGGAAAAAGNITATAAVFLAFLKGE
jgi:hypothetical protein